jgi:hypothetical protein
LDLQRKILAEAPVEEIRRTEKRPARGLEEVSHLYLSQSSDKAAEKAETPDIALSQIPSERVPSRTPFLLHNSPAVNRELILEFLHRSTAVLEEGLRAIDANIPCEPFGIIDLVAVDSQDQLCIINVDITQKDDAILKGIAYADWIVRNTPIVRRMYQGRVINFSAQPRLFLVAPDFSPLLKCMAQRNISLTVCCVAYRTVAMPGGTGILFDHA